MHERVIVPRPWVTLSEADLLTFCRERLPAYQVPVTSVVADALPRRRVVNLPRAELAAQYGAGRLLATQPSEPVARPARHTP